ncbi:MAG TPA: lysophospholipid acyltransferase family protein [Polyangia bacterium]|nr:lysophospholipid acyltransferase family protein [Polyangia bacterium]
MSLWNTPRLALRAVAAFLWTLLVHYFGVRLRQLFRPNERCLGAISTWGSGLAWIMGVRVHPHNRREGPMGDIVIANHMGFLDVPVLLRYFPAVFVIKMELRRVFYFGGCLAKQGHVFVDRGDGDSRQRAAADLAAVLEQGDRVIVFPEGRASPGAKRLPFRRGSFEVAQRLGKRVELCVIDYLPDRRVLEWDVNRPMRSQLADLFGRRRIDVSVEFFPAETVHDAERLADRYRDIVEQRLLAHDAEREALAAGGPATGR